MQEVNDDGYWCRGRENTYNEADTSYFVGVPWKVKLNEIDSSQSKPTRNVITIKSKPTRDA